MFIIFFTKKKHLKIFYSINIPVYFKNIYHVLYSTLFYNEMLKVIFNGDHSFLNA